MKRTAIIVGILLVVALVLLVAFGRADAQNQAPAFSHGPSIPMYTVTWDSTGDAVASMLASGAGYSFNFNLFPNQDGNVRALTLGVPFFVSLPDAGDFRFAVGATMGTFNNLISFGAAIDLVKTNGHDTGALLGEFSKANVQLLFNIGFNIGSGGAPPVNAQKAGQAADRSKPPGYLSW